MTKDMDMVNGNFFKNIIKFTVPVMLSGLLQLLYNACDLVVVGRFAGEDSLAAVGSTGSLTNLIVTAFMGISIGANVVCARSIGRKDEEASQKAVHTAILFSLFSGIFLTIFGIFTARTWLELMGTTTESIDKATLYLQIYFGGMIFNMVYNFGAAILRSIGETKKPLYYLAIAGLVNVLLNLVLVIFFHMDVAGVAIGTIVAQAISAVLVIRLLIKRPGYVNLKLKELKIDGKSLKDMILIGLPAGVQGALFSISNVLIQTAVNSFENTILVAGNTAASNIEGFIYITMNSFYQSCISFTGQNYGARKITNCKKILIICLLCAFVIGAVLGGVGMLFADNLLGIYTDSVEAIAYGKERFFVICSTYYLCGMMDVIVGSLRGMGRSIFPMFVSIVGICVYRIIWIYTVFYPNPSLSILYLSYPISWLLTGGLHLICFVVLYKRSKGKYELTPTI